MTIAERFWAKVVMIPEHPCWEWGGAMNTNGYAHIGYLGDDYKGPSGCL